MSAWRQPSGGSTPQGAVWRHGPGGPASAPTPRSPVPRPVVLEVARSSFGLCRRLSVHHGWPFAQFRLWCPRAGAAGGAVRTGAGDCHGVRRYGGTRRKVNALDRRPAGGHRSRPTPCRNTRRGPVPTPCRIPVGPEAPARRAGHAPAVTAGHRTPHRRSEATFRKSTRRIFCGPSRSVAGRSARALPPAPGRCPPGGQGGPRLRARGRVRGREVRDPPDGGRRTSGRALAIPALMERAATLGARPSPCRVVPLARRKARPLSEARHTSR